MEFQYYWLCTAILRVVASKLLYKCKNRDALFLLFNLILAPSGLFYKTISNFNMHCNTTHEDLPDDKSHMVSVQDREGE